MIGELRAADPFDRIEITERIDRDIIGKRLVELTHKKHFVRYFGGAPIEDPAATEIADALDTLDPDSVPALQALDRRLHAVIPAPAVVARLRRERRLTG
ncbi:MAG TPA: hypothetical protein VGR41_02795 [Actinomycetota bacterium]|nr:hypothetical protein [Actinomycetota bacterium]